MSRHQVSRILFVTGFGPDTNAKTLGHEFEKFGPLVRCDVPVTRRPTNTRYAFVEFKDERDAEDAYNKMHESVVGDARINVQWARRPPSNIWRTEAPPPRTDRDRPRDDFRDRDRGFDRDRGGFNRDRGNDRDRDNDRDRRRRSRSPRRDYRDDKDREYKRDRERGDDRDKDRDDRRRRSPARDRRDDRDRDRARTPPRDAKVDDEAATKAIPEAYDN